MPFTFTNSEQADIHFIYGFANGNSRYAAREYRRRFPNRRQPHHSVFVSMHRRFADQGLEKTIRGDRQNNRGRDRIGEAILREFNRNPTTSTRRTAVALGISQSKICQVLKRDHRRPYHFQPVQGLCPGDAERRLNYCRWVLNSIQNNRDFLFNILWTDESCFTRRGIVNFHNLHVWAHENPHAIRPRSFQHEFSTNVWIGIYGNHVFGPYFLPQRVNSQNFLQFFEEEHANMWEDIPLNLRGQSWIQLDGCPAHYGRNVRNWLNNNYPGRWIGRGGPVAWPPRSPDLTPLDFFVWGFIKEKVYTTPVNTLDELHNRIRDACNEIRVHHLVNLRRSIVRRCEMCIEKNGLHFEQSV